MYDISASRRLIATYFVQHCISLTDNGRPMRRIVGAPWMRTISKVDLRELINDVKRSQPKATSRAVAFVCAETFGLWHNRGRAKLCRYFKNHPPSVVDRQSMVNAIVDRLNTGQFSEQFKDQLSMAIRFEPAQLALAADAASASEREYVRRYAKWVCHVLNSSQTKSRD